MRYIKCNYLIIIFILLMISSSSFSLIGLGSTNQSQVHVYTCEDSNCYAYSGGADSKGQFNDDGEFLPSNYDDIEFNDDEFVNHNRYVEGEIQYHRFDFLIQEEISNILSIQIKWIGYGGGEKNIVPVQTYWGCGLWIKENGTYVKKANSDLNYKSELSINYEVDSIDSILDDGHLYFTAASNFVGGAIQTSKLWSDYVEVNVKYQIPQTQLQIQSPSSVFEDSDFDVEIIPNIEGILVNFSDINYYTNSEGIVTLHSPDVDIDTTYQITAYLQGYLPDETTINVRDNGTDDEIEELVITAPSSVYELDNFQIKVMSANIPIQDVSINFNDNEYNTNSNGLVIITAPDVDVDNDYLITASKSGFESDEKYIKVLDNSTPAQSQLVIHSPQYVLESNDFSIIVTSDSKPVSNVIVNFTGSSFLTNSSGKLTLSAPAVQDDTDYIITAYKKGYISDENDITILDETSMLIQLNYPNGGEILSGDVNISWTITNPPSESFNLSIYYKNSEESWIKIVEEYADIDGPYIWDTTEVEDGYPYWIKIVLTSLTKSCEDVSDFPFSINNDVSTSNGGWVYGYVLEQIDNSVYLVENALICVVISDNGFTSDRCVYTDENGEYTFYVPTGQYLIQASKKGYESQQSTVIIQEDEQIEQSFNLVKMEDELLTVEEDAGLLFDYMISDQTQSGIAGAKIDLDNKKVSYYSEAVKVSIQEVDSSSLSFNVEAPDGTEKKLIYIQVGTDSIMNIDNIDRLEIEYDGQLIQRKNLDYLINKKDSSAQAAWAGISTLNTDGSITYYLAILVPSFSQHSIKISSIPVSQVVDVLSNFLIYIVAIFIFGIIYISPFFLIRKTK